jgi:hypothetical protein
VSRRSKRDCYCYRIADQCPTAQVLLRSSGQNPSPVVLDILLIGPLTKFKTSIVILSVDSENRSDICSTKVNVLLRLSHCLFLMLPCSKFSGIYSSPSSSP